MDVKKQIEKLILDQLDDQQLDKLFIEFLKAPEWFDYYLREEQKYKTKSNA